MTSYLRILRIPNLIIVAIVQSVLYFGILIPVFDTFGIKATLGKEYFILFVITTVIITAAGYVVNDILDAKADLVNKPDKYIIGRDITEKYAWIYYIILIFIGFVTALYIAININKISYMFIYIVAVILLYLYSKYFKKQLLSGNIFVSLFSSLVLGIILIFEMQGLKRLHEIDFASFEFIMNIFFGFMIFSFFISLYRELVKDIEDVEGDAIIKARTSPIVYGIERTKFLSGIISVIILLFLFYWMRLDMNTDRNCMKIYVLIFVIMPLFYSVLLLKNAKSKFDFSKLSKVIKVIMATGISILFFYL